MLPVPLEATTKAGHQQVSSCHRRVPCYRGLKLDHAPVYVESIHRSMVFISVHSCILILGALLQEACHLSMVNVAIP